MPGSETAVPLYPQKQRMPHSLGKTWAFFGTQQFCAPLGSPFL